MKGRQLAMFCPRLHVQMGSNCNACRRKPGRVADRRAARTEELEFARDYLGVSFDEAARHLGITPESLQRWCVRTGWAW